MSEAVTAPPISIWTKLAYGIGSVAYGVKDAGFGYFLLLFYGTVVGLEPGLVGLVIFLALIVDGFSDPIVGYISDNWRSKWGRRHPFMYAAALPVALSFFLIWNPPDWSDGGLLIYLFVLAVLIRTFITFYETPSSALLPELSEGYLERTKLQAYRLYFGWTGGSSMSILMFGVLLVPTAAYPIGILNRDGYAMFGIVSSLLIFSAIMISALGTHARIPYLKPPPPKRKIGLAMLFSEIFETLSEKSFFAIFVASLFGAIATGLSGALAFLMLRYFWEFSEGQIFIWTSLVLLSAFAGLIVAPAMTRWLGKKRAVLVLGIIAFSMAPMPVVLRLFGLMPPNGDPLLYPLILTINTIDIALIIALQAVLFSMIADLVEQSELKTGRRSEGVFYAAITFTRKCTQGLGLLVGGVVLSVAKFPADAVPGEVLQDTLWTVGAGYAFLLLLLWTCMMIAIGFSRIDQAAHEGNLRELAARRSGSST
ncbi:MAG: MFS transporter [Henriciella sp.]|nr:MFS transporter [Henriciella sp.]